MKTQKRPFNTTGKVDVKRRGYMGYSQMNSLFVLYLYSPKKSRLHSLLEV